jgi:alanine-glyoxylate transaminase/serine-glyoxylate transaminase/serine-pyruvate transaminase
MRVPEEILLIPGPVSIDPEIQRVLGGPVRAHYGDDWVAMYRRLTHQLAGIFRTGGDVVLLAGPGTAALETCFASALARDDEVLVATNGMFGDRLVEVAGALGLTVHTVRPADFTPVGVEQLEAALRAHPGVRAFAVVHHETSLGLLNPVRELCEEARQRGLLTIVDAVASFGGMPLEMDDWGIDLCVGVGNKCLGAPVGIAPIAVGERAWRAVDDGRPKAAGWYLNLATWRRYGREWGGWHPSPTTVPSNTIEALAAAVDRYLEEGEEAHIARFAAAAGRVREGLRELGFEMVVSDGAASPVTTAVWGLPGMDVRAYMEWMRREHGLRIGGGLGPLAGRAFRVGHMGLAAHPDVVDRYLRATGDYVRAM